MYEMIKEELEGILDDIEMQYQMIKGSCPVAEGFGCFLLRLMSDIEVLISRLEEVDTDE